jgi:putative glutamine amidotransferase
VPVRPVVGICAPLEATRVGGWELEAHVLPSAYAAAVQEAGAVALILPSDDAVAEAPDRLLGLLDALVLAGGGDVDPGTYGARPRPETRGTRPERDRFELALAHRALELDLPLLGIGRGMQMLNVAAGGTLDQHLDGHVSGQPADHEVSLQLGSLAARAAGVERLVVKSRHHQGIAELGEGLVPSGRSQPDGIVEAVEAPERRFALGVLWHPEDDPGDHVVAALVEAARAVSTPE